MAPPPLPLLKTVSGEHRQGLEAQALEVLGKIAELGEARAKEPSETVASAVAYYGLARAEFDRYEHAEACEAGSGAQFLEKAREYVEKSLQADPELAEALCSKVIVYSRLPDSQENARTAVEALEGLQGILRNEEELARRLAVPGILDGRAPEIVKTFRKRLMDACKKLELDESFGRVYAFIWMNKGARFLPEESVSELAGIFRESGLPEEKVASLIALPHSEPMREDTKENVELAKRLISAMSAEGKEQKQEIAETGKKGFEVPREAEKALRKVGIDPKNPAVEVVAKALFGEGLDKPTKGGWAIHLCPVAKEVYGMFSPTSEVLVLFGKWQSELKLREKTHNFKSSEKAQKKYLRACWRAGGALLAFAPDYKKLGDEEKESRAQNIGGNISQALILQHGQLIASFAKQAAERRKPAPAPVPIKAEIKEEKKEEKPCLSDSESRMERLGMILFGLDGKRSLCDIANRRYIPRDPDYANPFDNLLADPKHADGNIELVKMILDGKMRQMLESGSLDVSSAAAVAATNVAMELIAKDPQSKRIRASPDLQDIIVKKLTRSLLDRYFENELRLFVKRDYRDREQELELTTSPSNPREQKRDERKVLSSALRKQADGLKGSGTVLPKDIDQAVTLIEKHKDALGRAWTEKLKGSLVAMKPSGKRDGGKLPSKRELASRLREMALVVENLHEK